MSALDQVSELLLCWEDAHRRGQPVTPEELCRDCPERLTDLRERIAALASMESLLDVGPTDTPARAPAGPNPAPPTDIPKTLSQPLSPAAPRPAPAPAAPAGRYRALRPHAHGGLGEVFVAEDDELCRPVALKRIRGKQADDPASRRRFLREAEITARLQHPGIVPVYGLTADAAGRPAYAMRFIAGESLHDAITRLHTCDRPRHLARLDGIKFRELLGRFVAVCNTVAYAHSRGVLHRDLKPANVMLGPYGETLVVDWGLAKPFVRTEAERAAGEETLRPTGLSDGEGTSLGEAVGTPAYMSPEQAQGRLEDLGPASDLFSLGAVLYAILAGQAPYQGRSVASVLEKACQGDYPPPRKVKAGVPPALEAVCLKAMAREAEGRYGSALELAADVERWLADEPVTAYREPLAGRLRRWGRRHRGALIMATALIPLLAAAAVAGTWQAVRATRAETAALAARDAESAQRAEAERQRDAADEQRRRTRAAVDDMLGDEAMDWLTTQKVLLPQQRAFLERALRYYQEFAARAETEEDRNKLQAGAQFKVGRILQLLGRSPEAEQSYRAALDLRQKLAADFPAVPRYRSDLATSYNNQANLLKDLGKQSESEAAHRAALDLRAKLAAEFPDVPAYRRDLASTHNNLGNLLASLGRRPEAEAAFRAGLDLQRRLTDEAPGVLENRADLARTHNNLAILLADLGRRPEAEAAYRAARALQQRLADEDPAVPHYRQELARSHNNLGTLLADLGKRAEAEAEYRAAVSLQQRLADDFSAVPEYRSELAGSQVNLGILLADLGRWSEAEAAYRAALTLYAPLTAEFPAVPRYRRELGIAHNNLGNLLKDLGKRPEADAALRAALALRQRLAAEAPSVPRYRRELATTHNNLGNLLRDLGKRPEAEAAFRAALTLQRRLADEAPGVPRYRQELARSHNNLGTLLADLGQRPEAEAEYRAALALQQRLADEAPAIPEYRQELARTHHNLGALFADSGRRPEAEAQFRIALALRERLVADGAGVSQYAWELGDSCNSMGHLLRDGGEPQGALPWYGRSVEAVGPVFAREPRDIQARDTLRSGHWGKAQVLVMLGRHAEALKEWDRAIELDARPARAALRLGRAESLARTGDHARAAAEADAVLGAGRVSAVTLYDCARVHALATAQGDADQAERYAARAVELLRQAVGQGYKDVGRLKKDADLEPLRSRPDFQKLLAGLEAAGTPR